MKAARAESCYNIPTTLKLQLAVERGEVWKVDFLIQRFDYLAHPSPGLSGATQPCSQIEYYEIQLANYVARLHQSMHFVEMCYPGRVKRISFSGPHAQECCKKYSEGMEQLEGWHNRRYHNHKLKRGSAASEAYRSGLMEAVLDRCRIPIRTPEFYRQVFDGIRLRGVLAPAQRALSDQSARSVGLDDGLICDLDSLYYPYAESIRSHQRRSGYTDQDIGDPWVRGDTAD